MRALALSPHGTLYLEEGAAPADPSPIETALARDVGEGLFLLGANFASAKLEPTYAYFRDLARDVVTALCAEPALEDLRERVALSPAPDKLAALARKVPPMRGAEYATPEHLAGLWQTTLDFFRRDVAAHTETVAEYLHSRNPIWNLVGRVYFHLAENKNDPDEPFAFLATYTTRMGDTSKPQHRPLGKAVAESAGAKNQKALLALLVPVQKAAEKSALIQAMVDSGDIYHPLAWTPEDALAFLHEAPVLEESGVIVRVPNWWSAKKPPRAEVRVTVGAKEPSVLGTDSLLDFAVDVTLGEDTLTQAEVQDILQGAGGLRFVKGRWVEIDRERLGAVLTQWKQAERDAEAGLSFLESMRLLAQDAATEESASEPAWTRVEAGPWLETVLAGLRSPEGLDDITPGAALHAELRPYQAVGVKWLAWLHSLGLGGCLADDMGLGKTIQVLSLLLLVARKQPEHPSLLVVPASLLANWQAEAARFAPSLRLALVHPSAPAPDSLDDVDVVLTTYGTVTRTKPLRERTWNVVVLDEAQAIKNPNAKQTRAVKELRGHTRLALTGTPIENRLADLWSLFDFLAPGLLGSAKEFGTSTKALAKREADAYAPLRELVRPYILRRLKSDRRVIADLPDKTEIRTFCHLTRAQASLYQDAVATLAKKIASEDGMKRRGAVLAALMAFKQICNHPSQWLGDGGWHPAASGKLARLRELCEPLAERQEKVLVFTQFREMTEPLAAFLAGVFGRPGLVLHGNTAVKQRQKLVDEFQSDLGPPFFVLSLKAGGTGLNLTAASHVVHFDRWWNPAVEDQATDRAYRIGQKKNVLVHKLVCRGTVEERIDDLIASKKKVQAEILSGGGELLLTEMSNAELLRLVSLDLTTAVKEAT